MVRAMLQKGIPVGRVMDTVFIGFTDHIVPGMKIIRHMSRGNHRDIIGQKHINGTMDSSHRNTAPIGVGYGSVRRCYRGTEAEGMDTTVRSTASCDMTGEAK